MQAPASSFLRFAMLRPKVRVTRDTDVLQSQCYTPYEHIFKSVCSTLQPWSRMMSQCYKRARLFTSSPVYNGKFNRLRWQLIADHNEWPNRITISYCRLDRNYWEVINLLFVFVTVLFYLNILKTVKMLQFWNKTILDVRRASFQRKRLREGERSAISFLERNLGNIQIHSRSNNHEVTDLSREQNSTKVQQPSEQRTRAMGSNPFPVAVSNIAAHNPSASAVANLINI